LSQGEELDPAAPEELAQLSIKIDLASFVQRDDANATARATAFANLIMRWRS
jgi:hypothetical protein